MKRWMFLMVIGFSFGLGSAAWSYDTEMGNSYENLFAPCSGAKVGKMLHLVKPEGFVKNIKDGKEYVVDPEKRHIY